MSTGHCPAIWGSWPALKDYARQKVAREKGFRTESAKEGTGSLRETRNRVTDGWYGIGDLEGCLCARAEKLRTEKFSRNLEEFGGQPAPENGSEKQWRASKLSLSDSCKGLHSGTAAEKPPLAAGISFSGQVLQLF
eukprot:556655-Pelagomonas_calceolata.AAC.2